LFNLYIQELLKFTPPTYLDQPRSTSQALLILYADDVIVICPEFQAQLFLSGCQQFSDQFKLSFSVEKCIQSGGLSRYGLHIAEPFPLEEKFTYLGIQFDRKTGMNEDDMYEKNRKKIMGMQTMLSRIIAPQLTVRRRAILYNCFIRPHFEYAAQLFLLLDTISLRLLGLYRLVTSTILDIDKQFNPHWLQLILNSPTPHSRSITLAAIFIVTLMHNSEQMSNHWITHVTEAIEPIITHPEVHKLLRRFYLYYEKEKKKNPATVIKIISRDMLMERYNIKLKLNELRTIRKICDLKEAQTDCKALFKTNPNEFKQITDRLQTQWAADTLGSPAT
jgi:hypothetical protein